MDTIAPASYKACSHCYSRKVKCDGVLPRCGKCNDTQHECDITSRVFYSYQVVKELADKVEDLETRLEASQPRSTGPSIDFDDAHRFDVNVQLQQSGLAWEHEQRDARPIDQISQELGALSLGRADMMAQYYGKRSELNIKAATDKISGQRSRDTVCQILLQQLISRSQSRYV